MCWGENLTFQIGDGTSTDRLAPVLAQLGEAAVAVGAPDLSDIVTHISARSRQSFAVHNNGAVSAWGGGGQGCLGTGMGSTSQIPRALSRLPLN